MCLDHHVLMKIPDWVPDQYIGCPVLITMRKLEILSPAAYFSMIRRPSFLTQDKLGIDRRFFYTPDHLPSGESPLTVILNARGRYQYYQFASREVLARLKARKEITPAAQPSLPSAPLPTLATVPVVVPSAEP